jgi:hypothetical protein
VVDRLLRRRRDRRVDTNPARSEASEENESVTDP